MTDVVRPPRRAAILAELEAGFDAPVAELRADLDEFLTELRGVGFVKSATPA